MNLIDNVDLRKVAEGMVWFHEPETTLRDPYLFLSHLMCYGTLDDFLTVNTANKYFIDDYREVLDNPPAGLFDDRSWYFWHLRLGYDHVPPLPIRKIPGVS